MTRPFLRVLGLLLVLLLTWQASAFAAPPQKELDRAREHFSKGERHYALGRFAEALGEYQAAYESAPLPEFLFNIGQCHRNLGNLDLAIFSFRKYLREKPDATNRVAVQATIGELEAEKQELEQQARARIIKPSPDTTPRKGRSVTASWWFWGGIAAGVAGAAALTWAVTSQGDGIPDSDLGNLDFP